MSPMVQGLRLERIKQILCFMLLKVLDRCLGIEDVRRIQAPDALSTHAPNFRSSLCKNSSRIRDRYGNQKTLVRSTIPSTDDVKDASSSMLRIPFCLSLLIILRRLLATPAETPITTCLTHWSGFSILKQEANHRCDGSNIMQNRSWTLLL